MADLDFTPHAREGMANDGIPEVGVYHVVGDADDVIVRKDGRTEYIGAWEGRTFMVVIEDDGLTVVTVFERERRQRRRRRRWN